MRGRRTAGSKAWALVWRFGRAATSRGSARADGLVCGERARRTARRARPNDANGEPALRFVTSRTASSRSAREARITRILPCPGALDKRTRGGSFPGMMSRQRKTAALLATTGCFGLALVAQETQARDPDRRTRDREVEVTGLVEGLTGTCPNLSFTVQGQKITTGARTEFDDGTCESVRNGQRVEIEGYVENGTLVADEVDLD